MWSNNFSQHLELDLETPRWLAVALGMAGAAAALAWWHSGFGGPVRHTLAAGSLGVGIRLAVRWHLRRPALLAISSSGEITISARAGGVPVPALITHWWRMRRLMALGWRAMDGQAGAAIWSLKNPVTDAQRRALVRLRLPQVTDHRVEWF